jgi:hypothetical protein
MITTKKVRETEKYLAHINVFYNETYLGYITKNKSKYSEVDENWNFSSKYENLPSCFDKTKDLLLKKVENLLHELNLI